MVVAGIVIALLLLAIALPSGPTSGQIRLDTGDLRYCWHGIPIRYEQMPEPERSKLLVLASKSPGVTAEWVTCTTHPQDTEYRPHALCRYFYHLTAIWADEDPKIARWAMDDMVDFIRHGSLGLPNCAHVLSASLVDWRDQKEVKDYCAAHGYIPPPAPPTSKP